MYEQLIKFLNDNHVAFRELHHVPEGRCEAISQIRGNKLEQAAKSLVVMVKRGKERYYYLAVLPGNRSVDLQAIMKYGHGDGVMLAPVERAFNLTGCEMGTVLPFSFNENLKLIVDPSLKNVEEIVFNAARLDVSLFIKTQDYLRVSNPTFVNIAK